MSLMRTRKRTLLASACKIALACAASKTSVMGDESAKCQIVPRFSKLMKSLLSYGLSHGL